MTTPELPTEDKYTLQKYHADRLALVLCEDLYKAYPNGGAIMPELRKALDMAEWKPEAK